MKLKLKLILIFILLKILPLMVVAYIAIVASQELSEMYERESISTLTKSEELIINTAETAIKDSIEALDKTSQSAIEKMSVQVANEVANFLYERDQDLLTLSKLPLTTNTITSFHNSKNREITVHKEYSYDDATSKWLPLDKQLKKQDLLEADLIDNNKEFHKVHKKVIEKIKIPLYKEITFITTNGKEQLKVSSINNEKKDISQKKNTYISSEEYYPQLQSLKEGEIYVSSVIGEYVGSGLIGTFTKEKAEKFGLEFKPEEHGYAGVENPKGKKFSGIIRFATPVFKKGKKVGYITLALDHAHIMEFTDYIEPTHEFVTDISDASDGNYGFMWDNKGRSISHPRDYFIVGYDKNTGEPVKPWLSADIEQKLQNSKESDLNKFLENYPTFQEQSLSKKPNISQIKERKIALDCRYLNFAPQCQGWMQLTEDGGYGSFIIYWSKVWKLTTAAAIPYYTGQYAHDKRGFGFVTIGANVDDFHKAATTTKQRIDSVLNIKIDEFEQSVQANKKTIVVFIQDVINKLTITTIILTLLMIVIAILLANTITKKIYILIAGTKEFAKNNFAHKIPIDSKDEFGQLSIAFNKMSNDIAEYIEKESQQKEILKKRVEKAVAEIRDKDATIIKQSRLVAMSDMMKSIAHHWRQPLNVMSLNLSNLELLSSEGTIEKKDIDDTIERGYSSIDELSKTIDDFGKLFSPDSKKTTFDLRENLEKAIGLINSTIKAKQIELHYESIETITITGYQNEISQIVLNLISNSKDAIVSNRSQTREITVRAYTQNNKAIIEVEDSGGGIPKDIIDKIFEPYFTTKTQGEGTGVGLFMSKQLIEQDMAGVISASNTENGAKLMIELPLN